MDEVENAYASEIAQLEAVAGGRAKPTLRMPATLGRLAELYLRDDPDTVRVERSIVLIEHALAAVSADDPLHPKLLHVRAMGERLRPTPDVEHRAERAARWDREAIDSIWDVSPVDAIAFAADWADWAWECERWREAADAYQRAHSAVERHIRSNTIGLAARLELISECSRFALRGALALHHGDDPHAALVLLERAGDLFALRGEQERDLIRLADEGHERLRDRAVDTVAAARQAVLDHPPDAYGRVSAEAHAAGERANAVVKEIRAVPGFERYASPSSLDDIVAAARESPIVYLAPTDRGSLLCVVDGDQISSVLLDVTSDELATTYLTIVRAEHDGDVDEQKVALDGALGWLGRTVALQLAYMLGSDRAFVLVPFGQFTLLPIASAWIERDGPAPNVVIHRFPFDPKHVAIASSARLWFDARRRAAHLAVDSALVVSDPWPLPAIFDRLRLGDAEADLVQSHLPSVILRGPQAHTDAVLAELGSHGLVHFSCHGYPQQDQGFSAVLLLARGEVLTVGHLLGTQALRARVVVLSACSSSAPAIRPAQAISLPFVLLASGAAAVVGTSWSVDEVATLLLLGEFYRTWLDENLPPREALGAAKAYLVNATATELRRSLAAEVLAGDAGAVLRTAQDDEHPYAHPWYWSGFFLAGA